MPPEGRQKNVGPIPTIPALPARSNPIPALPIPALRERAQETMIGGPIPAIPVLPAKSNLIPVLPIPVLPESAQETMPPLLIRIAGIFLR